MQTLTTQQIKEMRTHNNNIPIINVLPESAYEGGHIPRTPNVPLGDDNFVSRVEKFAGGKDQPVVVYCANEQCDASPKAAKKLEEAGFSHVYDYEGGTEAWKDAGEPVERS